MKKLLEKHLILAKTHKGVRKFEVKALQNIIHPEDWLVALYYRAGKKVKSQIMLEELTKKEAKEAEEKLTKLLNGNN